MKQFFLMMALGCSLASCNDTGEGSTTGDSIVPGNPVMDSIGGAPGSDTSTRIQNTGPNQGQTADTGGMMPTDSANRNRTGGGAGVGTGGGGTGAGAGGSGASGTGASGTQGNGTGTGTGTPTP